MATCSDAAPGDSVEKGCRITRVVVHTHALSAQRIDQNEEDVRVAAVGEVSDVVEGSDGALIQIIRFCSGFGRKVDLDERREIERDRDHTGEYPGPTFGEQGFRHGAGR